MMGDTLFTARSRWLSDLRPERIRLRALTLSLPMPRSLVRGWWSAWHVR